VPVSGAFDRGAYDLANALLGNDPGAAALELTLLGGTYKALCPLAIALTGAAMVARVVSPDGRERPVRVPQTATLAAGERLIVGGAPHGARTYLAARGGWTTPCVLGSRSREVRLEAGDVVPAEPGTTPVRRPAGPLPAIPDDAPIRIVAGPDAPPGFASDPAGDRTFRLGAQSDRMGLRLEGAAWEVDREASRLSAPVAPGAVQVAGGRAIILGVACGTMGGYPHVAHVISADLGRLAQARPGDLIRLRRVGLDEARRIDREDRRGRAAQVLRVATLASDGTSTGRTLTTTVETGSTA
jgi:allophanate hydrolase subunit 2